MTYDIFICHASEDKDDFVRHLARTLRYRGLKVWYDEFALKMGDSLADSINQGLANSNYGVVVISLHFINKRWPQREIGALFARDFQARNPILPIWHNIQEDDIKRYYPLLADIVAIKSTEGMDAVVKGILRVVKPNLIREKRSAIKQLAGLCELIRVSLQRESDKPEFHQDMPRVLETLKAVSLALREIDKTGDIQGVRSIVDKAKEEITVGMRPIMYCVKCRQKREGRADVGFSKSDEPYLRTVCSVCGTGMYKIGRRVDVS